MFLQPFHSPEDTGIRISAQQASRFAKQIAGDFNPIHDPDSRRFCVPGDLLFALALQRLGLSRRMMFRFVGMVDADELLNFPGEQAPGGETPDEKAPAGETLGEEAAALAVTTQAGRTVLEISREGPASRDAALIEALTRCYVAFSGENFPHVLQPLLARHGVMFNPKRPLIIYDRMDFTLEAPALGGLAAQLRLQLEDARLTVQGKRGDVLLSFGIHAGGQRIGSGTKTLVVSSLRAYDEDHMQEIISAFNQRKAAGVNA